jgi:UDP-3-O-[3-hydroxymyristoyl] glucosamine N-acyltransferase LpxD
VIDCATLFGDATIIRQGVKLDNLIQIAHNVEIGKNTVIAAQTGNSGSTKVGENCMLAGQVGIAGHIVIANNTGLGAQAGVSKSIKEPGKKWMGSPATDFNDYFKSTLSLKSFQTSIKGSGNLKPRCKTFKPTLFQLTNLCFGCPYRGTQNWIICSLGLTLPTFANHA